MYDFGIWFSGRITLLQATCKVAFDNVDCAMLSIYFGFNLGILSGNRVYIGSFVISAYCGEIVEEPVNSFSLLSME